MSLRVYLDWNATTPLLDAAVEAMARAGREAWGNPSSVHAEGRRARREVEGAREAVGALAGADPRDVVLTSGATEANNLAVRSLLGSREGRLVTSRLEHPSIVRLAEALERAAPERVRWLAVLPGGAVDLDDLTRALDEAPAALLALQAVNHETGVIQPVAEALALASARGVPVHVDEVQAWGRVRAGSRGATTRSLAGHKLRGPKGIGALVTREGLDVAPLLLGGAQERGVRPGTVDPVAAAGLAAAARHALDGPDRYARIARLRDRLEAALLGLAGPGRACVNGEGERAPHVTNVSFDGWSGAELVAALDLEGVAVASGSACSAGTLEPSPVIAAMLGPARAASAVRLSLGELTTLEDVDAAIAAFSRVLGRAR